MPTSNCGPFLANAIAAVDRYGNLTERTNAYRDSIDAETITWIEDRAGELYERAGALSLQGRRSVS